LVQGRLSLRQSEWVTKEAVRHRLPGGLV